MHIDMHMHMPYAYGSTYTGAVGVLLPLVTRTRDHAADLRKAKVSSGLVELDELLRESIRALAKLAELKANQRPVVESDVIHQIIRMLGAESADEGAVSIGVKQECLELLGHLADVPQCLQMLVSDGALHSLIALLHLQGTPVETPAAELLAKLAQVKEYQAQISPVETIPLLSDLLHSASQPAALAALHALNELLFDNAPSQMLALRAGVVEPCIKLARSDQTSLSSNAATLLCQIILADTSTDTRGKGHPKAGGAKVGAGGAPQPLSLETRLQMLSSMAMSKPVSQSVSQYVRK